ncbi:MAG: saccharopine dehydrogenase NADP-binding domain-containing protein [Pseudomonadota bacterium]
MRADAEFDIVVYGATGFTGKLVVEYMAQRHPPGSGLSWAMAGRSQGKLEQVRREWGAPADTPLVVADAADPASIEAMAKRAKCVLTTVGPYSLYGEPLVEACAKQGTDYVDLSGEVLWMKDMIEAHGDTAKSTGARIVHSCGFDSIPFDLGVQYLQEEAVKRFGAPCVRVRGRMRAMQGTFSGGTAASGAATMKAVQKDPARMQDLINPFALTGGFSGPDQPPGNKPMEEEGVWLAPFVMAPINTKNIHRSNALMGHAYGKDFVYDEMMVTGPGDQGKAVADAVAGMTLGGSDAPKPGEGPSKEEREAGHYDYVAIGEGPGGETLKVAVTGDKDPGYGSTSKIISEAAACLVQDKPDLPGGIYTPAPALGAALRERLVAHAGLTFDVEG